MIPIKDQGYSRPLRWPYCTRASRPAWLASLLAALLILATHNHAADLPATPLQERFTLKNFTVRDYKEDGALDWILWAKKAAIGKRRIHLEHAQARFYDRTGKHQRMIVFAADCNYDKQKKKMAGDKYVQLRTDTMTLEGVGFDMDVKNRRLRIHSKVTMKIYGTGKKLMGEK